MNWRFNLGNQESPKMRYPFTILLITLFLFSCKKDPSILPAQEPPIISTEIPVAEYTQLRAGNYWIYARYQVDTNGNEICLTPRDSVYISGDTLINGKTYSKKVGGFWSFNSTQYLRDSSSYLVNHLGQVVFSSTDFVNILYSYTSLYVSAEYQMADKGLVVSVPAGNFSTYNYQGTIHLEPGLDTWGTPRNTGVYYSQGIGIVKEVHITTGNPGTYEARLIKYSVN